MNRSGRLSRAGFPFSFWVLLVGSQNVELISRLAFKFSGVKHFHILSQGNESDGVV